MAIFIFRQVLFSVVIHDEDLDGRTHVRGLRDNIPEVFPHEDAYIGFTGHLSKVSSELDSDNVNVYSRFAEMTDDVKDAFEHFFDQIDNALFLLDNGDVKSAREHVSEARENYLDAFEACDRLYNDPVLNRIDGLERPVDYIQEVRMGLESVEEKINDRQIDFAYSPQRDKAI